MEDMREYECLQKELSETRRALEQVKHDYEAKCRECNQARHSLMDLQTELMRKSMHVGSLAFAIEGQVKEKSKWFSSLTLLTSKLEALKLQHLHVAAEASSAHHALLSDLSAVADRQAQLNRHLNTQLLQGANERKQLYNRLLELKGNIRVFCRCRPFSANEIASPVVDFESAKDGELTVKSNGRKIFKFDAVFCPQADQADVFKDTAPFATSVLDGYNVCIFAYGQTGTGKTFTMEGTHEARGVNFRILDELFRLIKQRNNLYRYNVSVSALEVYNEQIRDLLGGPTRRLEVRQVSEGIHDVPGLAEAHVSNMNEVWEVLQTGSNARAVGSTNANEHSSRSHCIHRVMVKGENLLNGECSTSKLWLVDLAGSERVAKTEVLGERLKETQNINRSLSALGDVISALATKSPHVPFRNSKLTHLLQDSLGGDSKTLMFVQISPHERDLGETICSLNFASRVRGVELGPAKRQLDATEYMRYKQLAEKAKLDTKTKDLQIRKMEDAVHGLELKLKERDLKNKNLLDKVKELESQLLVERKLARQHVDTKIAEQQMKHQQEEPIRAPLGNRTLASLKNVSEPLNEKKSFVDPSEKENIPEMAEPMKNRRASICPFGNRPRRNSLIPFPIAHTNAAPQFLPLVPIPADDLDDECLPKHTTCESPRVPRKVLMRRSLQRKFQTKAKSPMLQTKVRVSIGRLAHRAARRVVVPKGMSQNDKERGWNIGTLGRS